MKKFITPILFTMCLTTCLSACNGKDKSAGMPGAGMPPPEVDVIVAGRGNATITQTLPGRVQAYRTAQVRAQVGGVVEKRLFTEGSEVRAGESLFKIDPKIYQAEAESTRADLAMARQTVERYKSLLEIKAVSQQEFDLAMLKSKQAESALVRAEEDLRNANVHAAISGHIGRSLVTEGALVGKGEFTLLATIDQLDPIYVNFTQSGADLLRLRQAIKSGKLKRTNSTKVEILLEDGSVYAHSGKIYFTDLAVDSSTGAVSLRAEFPNPDREILPGMFVSIRFPEASADNVIRIPQRAVQAGPQGQFVMVVGSENKATPVIIKTSSMADTDFIVAEGLKGGEQIIVNGLQKARPGTVVKPVPIGQVSLPSSSESAPINKK